MQVSQFEIHRLVQRALEALGAGYGVDRDGARAVAWLEAHDLPGLAALAAALPGLERGIRPLRLEPGSPGNLAIDAGRTSAIAFASAAIDLVCTYPAAAEAGLHIRACRSALFLIPAALENAAGAAVRLDWRRVTVEIGSRDGFRLFLAAGEDLAACLLEAEPSDIEVRTMPGGHSWPAPLPGSVESLNADELARRFARSLNQGISVDPIVWHRIDGVAARVQVPASEESRRRGAGGGDANA
jgi:hypothetical protein